MHYLNHAGTSHPKPRDVLEATTLAMSADPESWGALYESAHARACRHFALPDPSRFLFTTGCTQSLAMAFTSIDWRGGDRILMSGVEHHALSRWPQHLATTQGISWDTLPYTTGAPVRMEDLQRELSCGDVRLVAVTMASNVTGELLPIAPICALAKEYGVPVLLDAAQVAGVAPVDVRLLDPDLFVFSGHKGPQGPQGVGGFYAAPRMQLTTPAASCAPPSDPQRLDRCASSLSFCDVGSVTLASAAGLAAGLGWLEAHERSTLERTRPMMRPVLELLDDHPQVTVYGALDAPRIPLVSFTHATMTPSELERELRARGVMGRAGLHCAPLAHETLGALDGTMRLSMGATTTHDIARDVLAALKDVLGGHPGR
ncbi:MAG: aminotransferase class V-fold PLP-dependent enzyme [Myxococcota bacterium]